MRVPPSTSLLALGASGLLHSPSPHVIAAFSIPVPLPGSSVLRPVRELPVGLSVGCDICLVVGLQWVSSQGWICWSFGNSVSKT